MRCQRRCFWASRLPRRPSFPLLLLLQVSPVRLLTQVSPILLLLQRVCPALLLPLVCPARPASFSGTAPLCSSGPDCSLLVQ